MPAEHEKREGWWKRGERVFGAKVRVSVLSAVEWRGNLCSTASRRDFKKWWTCRNFDALTLLWAYATHVLLL